MTEVIVTEGVVRHVHENKENRPDSIEIGTPSKGGAIKVYVNLSGDLEEVRRLIDNAVLARSYMASKIAGEST